MSLFETIENIVLGGGRAGYTPAVRVTLDGVDITSNLIPAPFGAVVAALSAGVALVQGRLPSFGELSEGSNLLSISITDNEGKKSDSVELEIDNRDRRSAPEKGTKFEVWFGYVETGLVYMGQFQTDSWTKKSAPRTMTISAKAVGLTTEIKSPKSRSYHDTTVGDIVDKVAGKNSLSAKTHPEMKSIKIGHIDQSNESDVHFLTRLADRVGGVFKLANGDVIFNKAGSGSLPSGEEAPVFEWSEAGCTSWSASGSERGSYGSASAPYTEDEEGEREEVETGSGEPKYRDRKLYKTKDEAEVASKAKLSSLNRGKVSYSREEPMAPEVFSGARATVFDTDPDVDGLYQIKTVTHKISGSGATTSSSCESTNEDGGGDTASTGSGKPSKDGGDEGSDAENDAIQDAED